MSAARPHPPLTLSELVDQLCTILINDRAAGELPVRFGIDATPVCGGIAYRPADGAAYLSLAPMPLDEVGGF